MDLSALSYSHIYWIFLLPLIGAGADIVTGWIQASVNGTFPSPEPEPTPEEPEALGGNA